jgi:hypothetical protein
VVIDIDHFGNADKLKTLKSNILRMLTPEIMFISPSGDGLKVVFLTNVDEGTHQEYFAALHGFFASRLGIEIDTSGRDIARSCFLCHDSEVYYSDTPTILGRDFIDHNLKNSGTSEIKNVTPPANDKIQKLEDWVNREFPFIEGKRHLNIVQLAGACNRFAIEENVALEQCKQYAEPEFDLKEIENIVRGIYKNTAWHGKAIDQYPGNDDDDVILEPETNQVRTPLLPIYGFPPFIRELIEHSSKIYGLHRDFWAGAILSATSLSIGNSIQLQTKYLNSPLLWIAIVAPSGVGKSHPLNFAFKPISDFDWESKKKFDKELANYEAAMELPPNERIEQYGDEIQRPKFHQFLLTDATPEAVVEAHEFNRRGICIIRDELMGWVMDFGRYNRSGEVENWLSCWSQQPMRFNRKGKPPLLLDKPFINVIGGLHEDVLHDFAKDNRQLNGFLQRFCFVFPDQVMKPYYSDTTLPEEAIRRYHEHISNLMSITEESVLTLSSEAHEAYKGYVDQNADTINKENSGAVRSAIAKLDVIVLRIAITLHMSHWACSGEQKEQISRETMNAAIEMTEYFRLTSMKVIDRISALKPNIVTKKGVIFFLLKEMKYKPADVARITDVSPQYISKLMKNAG